MRPSSSRRCAFSSRSRSFSRPRRRASLSTLRRAMQHPQRYTLHVLAILRSASLRHIVTALCGNRTQLVVGQLPVTIHMGNVRHKQQSIERTKV
jgi:hypothetical protein